MMAIDPKKQPPIYQADLYFKGRNSLPRILKSVGKMKRGIYECVCRKSLTLELTVRPAERSPLVEEFERDIVLLMRANC
jgi:hypothetical protein